MKNLAFILSLAKPRFFKGILGCVFWIFVCLLSACAKHSTLTYTQVDRLARPFVAEVWLSSQTQTNLFNQTPPTQDLLTGLAGGRAEMNSIFTLIRTYVTGAGLSTAPSVAFVTSVFSPDVLRIDTTLTTTTVGSWAYNKTVTLTGGEKLFAGGRKIEDDVWDVTASYIFAGTTTGGPLTAVSNGADRVCYEGSSSSRCSSANDRLQGHSMLYGASSYNGNATFPFLATPN